MAVQAFDSLSRLACKYQKVRGKWPRCTVKDSAMALTGNRLALGTALAATLSLLASPVLAAELPLPRAAHAAAPDGDSAQHRRRHNGGVDAGDIIAGVLVLGGIAAIAGAASKADRRDRDYRSYPEQRPYPEDPRYRSPSEPYRGDYQSSTQSDGMGRAVDMCVAEVERSAEVGTVDNASRTGEGWFISGELGDGAPWACRIGNDGRITDVEVGDNSRADSGGYSSPAEGDNSEGEYYGSRSTGSQYDDATYARARAAMGTSQPAYLSSRE